MKLLSPVLACLAALAIWGVCAFLYYDVGVSADRIKESRDKIAVIAARDTFAKAAAQFLAETAPERSAVQFFITPVEGTAQSIELVENAAKLAGVKATVGAATIAPLGSFHEQLTVTVSAEGTYVGLARFATVLESLPRGSTLQSVALSATEKGWFGTYVVTFIKQK